MDTDTEFPLYNQWLMYREGCMIWGQPWLKYDEWIKAPTSSGLDTHLQRRLDQCVRSLDSETQRCADLSRKLRGCIDALREIASEDYRGSKPSSVYIAERALRAEGVNP